MYPKPIQQLIRAFNKLPSVGTRTSERFVFYLLKSGKKDVGELTLALKQLMETIRSCETCWDFSDKSPCAICVDTKRDQTTICVVQESQDVQAIDRTGTYHGLFHILRGVIKSDDEESIRFLKINELLKRLTDSTVKEIILALNLDLPGETTMMYIEQKIRETNQKIKITRLARGLPMGSDLQYADEITLGSALKHRTEN